MKREIKFRAWEKEAKRLWTVETWHIEDEYLDLLEIGKNVADPLAERTWMKQSYVELMQYTGLKDKNCVEIYEGDIVKNEKGKVGYVTFLQQEAGYVVVTNSSDYKLGHRNTNESYDQAQYHEVIGNIHEKPELLKGGITC